MTAVAIDVIVLSTQGKVSTVMIEDCNAPGLFAVALNTILAEPALVDIVVLMTIHTTVRGVTELVSRFMTGIASCRIMRTLKGIIRYIMIKSLAA